MSDGEPTVFGEVSVSPLESLEEEAEVLALGQTEGVSHKKSLTDPDPWTMTLGVSSGGTAHGDFGFSDDETEEVTDIGGDVAVTAGQAQQPAAAGFFTGRVSEAVAASVGPSVQTEQTLNEAPAL